MDLIHQKFAVRIFKNKPFGQSLLLWLLFWGFAPGIFAQSARSYVHAGDKAVKQKDFGAAIQHYGTALQRKSNDAALLWKYAECARELHAYPLAEKKYRQLGDLLSLKKANPLWRYRLAEVLIGQGRYEEAAGFLEQFLAQSPAVDTAFARRARFDIESCRWAQQQQNSAAPGPQVRSLGTKINSPYSDFAPYVAGDTLFFSSYRFDKRATKNAPRSKITKLMYAVKNGRARELTRGLPTSDTAHIAHTAFTNDGHFFFFTQCKNLNASDIRCEIWLAVKDIRGKWGTPVRLPEPINQAGYTSTHPMVAYDSLDEQLKLWFVSDRPGGKGQLDIWYAPLDTIWFCPCNVPVSSRKALRLPAFEPPVNVTALNSAGNDITPFYHEPSQRLFFSSDSRRGLGGYDIFSAQHDSTGFSSPENAGPGLNTSYNDLYFVLKRSGKAGYLSSNRPGSQYLDEENKACCNDLYAVQYLEPVVPEQPLTQTPTPTPRVPIERPMIPIERLQDPDPVERDPEPEQLSDFEGLPLYFDNDEPDKRTRRTRTQKSYAETAQAYLAREAEYGEKFAGGLPVSKREQAAEQVEAFFDSEVRRGYERLDLLCDMLLTRLQKGESVEVIIKGFTSPRAESDYNLALGKRRISSVRNQFEVYGSGALVDYLRSGKLKISEASFGETTARRDISDKLDDERNSIYHPDAARERRVEIVEIKEGQ